MKEGMMQYQIDIFLSSLDQFWTQVATFFPKLLAVLVILFFGWICAKAACIGLKRILELVNSINSPINQDWRHSSSMVILISRLAV